MQDSDVQSFFQYLKTEKRYSSHTLDNYQRDIKYFTEFCYRQSITDWPAIDTQHIRSFVSQMHRQGLSGKSIQRQLSSLRSLFRFLLKQRRVKQNPVTGVSAPKSPRKLPEVVTPDVLDHLMDIDLSSPLAVRDKAIMELFYGCGLRLSELVGLDLSSIEWSEQTLNVLGKGRKQRRLPFGEKARQALKHWLKIRGQYAADTEQAVFVSSRGQRISPSSIQQRLKKWAREKGIDQRIYPHLMRHSFAS
ncbi:MAG: tyrosine recombinase XerC, partial [Gammaproteobacteria bacterium]|nr:tyrosine recombinase XerC [Gammaproteobacteria bacterium]